VVSLEFEFDPEVERITAVVLCVRSAFGISSFVLPLESSVLHSAIAAVVVSMGFRESEFLPLGSCTGCAFLVKAVRRVEVSWWN